MSSLRSVRGVGFGLRCRGASAAGGFGVNAQLVKTEKFLAKQDRFLCNLHKSLSCFDSVEIGIFLHRVSHIRNKYRCCGSS